jgi:uncharacterized protein
MSPNCARADIRWDPVWIFRLGTALIPLLQQDLTIHRRTMATVEKIDHGVTEHHDDSSNGAPLSRQVTVTLTPDQYERLFFQPSPPRRGDYAKRFGNPTLLGLLGFLIPYTSTMLTLCQFSGAVPPTTLIGLNGDYYFLGCIAMNVAAICEFILGNSMIISSPSLMYC